MSPNNLLGLNFTQPIELVLLLTQLLCYLNQYYVVVFLLGPLPFIAILFITFANSRALTALLCSNSTHQPATPDSPNSQYCKKCKGWIIGRDHHCVFTGRCVQKLNYRYFLSYLLYSYLLSSLLVASIARHYELLMNLRELDLKHSIPLVFGTVSGVYFMVFTGGLLASSWRSIILGIYTVDEIKKVKTPALSNSELRLMWFKSDSRKQLLRAFRDNWKTMVGEEIGWKEILLVL